jgi:hypothetical protein
MDLKKYLRVVLQWRQRGRGACWIAICKPPGQAWLIAVFGKTCVRDYIAGSGGWCQSQCQTQW